MAEGTSSLDAKSRLRRELRSMRRALTDQPARSERIRRVIVELEAIRNARRVLVFDSIPGEPEMDGVRDDLAARGVEVCVPEDGPTSSWPDVVIVPGVAFTVRGDRLGQGGGWYDRYLATTRAGCIAVGVCFREQLRNDLPTEPHDVTIDVVVTDDGMVQPSG
ncbi:MAG: 5-formyltetrahydrofolate cyclo-ligase [Actinomycetota bacterium]